MYIIEWLDEDQNKKICKIIETAFPEVVASTICGINFVKCLALSVLEITIWNGNAFTVLSKVIADVL